MRPTRRQRLPSRARVAPRSDASAAALRCLTLTLTQVPDEARVTLTVTHLTATPTPTQVPDEARAMAKRQLRRDAAAVLRSGGPRSEDLAEFMDLVLQPSVQASLIAYLQALKKKGDKGK